MKTLSVKQYDLLAWLTHFYGIDGKPAATVPDLFWDFHAGSHIDPDFPNEETIRLSWKDYSYEGIRSSLNRLREKGLIERTGSKPPFAWEPTRAGLEWLAEKEGWRTLR